MTIAFLPGSIFLKLLHMYIFIFIYFWLAWVGFFSSCGNWGQLSVAVRGLLAVRAALVAEHGLSDVQASAVAARGLWLRFPGSGAQAQ